MQRREDKPTSFTQLCFCCSKLASPRSCCTCSWCSTLQCALEHACTPHRTPCVCNSSARTHSEYIIRTSKGKRELSFWTATAIIVVTISCVAQINSCDPQYIILSSFCSSQSKGCYMLYCTLPREHISHTPHHFISRAVVSYGLSAASLWASLATYHEHERDVGFCHDQLQVSNSFAIAKEVVVAVQKILPSYIVWS